MRNPTMNELIAAVLDAQMPDEVRHECALELARRWRAGEFA